jgi:hypothetical protein
MKRRIFLVIAVLLISIGIFIVVRLISGVVLPKGKGGLQVTSNIEANVFLNDRPIGKTPILLINADQALQSGTYDLKISPISGEEQPFIAKVPINPGVLTAVERVFLPGALSSSSVLYFEEVNDEDAMLFISSVPDNALVSIDGESRGVTPLDIKSLPASEHEVEIQKNGFAKKTVRIRAVAGYKLVLNVILGTESDLIDVPRESITPSPSQQVSPTPPSNVPQVLIEDTPTGFLRVRATPSTSAEEIGRVNPGEIYELVDENASWYKIKLANGTEGWISSTYAEKQGTETTQ